MQPERLVIGKRLLQHIVEHCMEEKPYEACGILTGRNGRVENAYATDNVKRSPIFYEVDQDQQEMVLSRMEAQGEGLLAIYHSHPTAPAEPSANDIRMAIHYPDALRVIISLLGPTAIRAYLIHKGKVHDVPVFTAPEPRGAWHDLRGGSPFDLTRPGRQSNAGIAD